MIWDDNLKIKSFSAVEDLCFACNSPVTCSNTAVVYCLKKLYTKYWLVAKEDGGLPKKVPEHAKMTNE